MDPDDTLPPVNLAAEDYTDEAQWKKVNMFDYTTQDSPNELIKGDRVQFDGAFYEYVGDDRLDPGDILPPVDLAAEDYTDGALWSEVNSFDYTTTSIEAGSVTISAQDTSRILSLIHI